MDVRFAPPELRRLDLLRGEALALSCFSDERPLRGAAGLVDWRFGGFLSRQLREGRVDGTRREVTLVPGRGRLSFDKLFLIGLGPRADFDLEAYAEACDLMLATLAAARLRAAACALPGRHLDRVEPAEAMEQLLRAAARQEAPDELVVIDDAAAQKVMESILQREQRRARAHNLG